MIIFGLLLLLAVAGVGTWIYLALSDMASPPVSDLSALGVTIGFSPLALLAIGFGLALALAIGYGLIRAGIGRKSRQRKERKSPEREAQENRKVAEEAAARRLETERNAPRTFTGPVDDSTVGWKTTDGGTGTPPPPPPPRS